MPSVYGALLVPLLLACSAAFAEETIWLRGRGSDVWIERGDAAREPRDARKGVTRVVTPPGPAVGAGAVADEARPSAVVVLDGPHWASADQYENDYTPRFYHPHSYRLYPVVHPRYRYVRPWRHSCSGHDSGYRYGDPFFPGYPGRAYGRTGGGFGGRHRGHGRAVRAGGPAYRNAGPYGGSVGSGGYVERGGAYRRVR